MIRKKLISEYEMACFERDVCVTNKHRQCDEVEHFSAHALINRIDYIWNNLMINEEREYIENMRQANFETTMLMLELDHG